MCVCDADERPQASLMLGTRLTTDDSWCESIDPMETTDLSERQPSDTSAMRSVCGEPQSLRERDRRGSGGPGRERSSIHTVRVTYGTDKN